jgi:hypothetical protein
MESSSAHIMGVPKPLKVLVRVRATLAFFILGVHCKEAPPNDEEPRKVRASDSLVLPLSTAGSSHRHTDVFPSLSSFAIFVELRSEELLLHCF